MFARKRIESECSSCLVGAFLKLTELENLPGYPTANVNKEDLVENLHQEVAELPARTESSADKWPKKAHFLRFDSEQSRNSMVVSKI